MAETLKIKGKASRSGLHTAAVALAVAALCTIGGIGYAKVVHPTIVAKNFGVVSPGKLYRSGELTPAATAKVVREHGIKTIVDLGAYDKDPVGERLAQRTAEALNVERHVFRLEGDGRGNPNAYVEALRIITDPAKQPVLVHCSAGSQRTGACILLYRELVEDKPIATQWPEAQQYHHDPKDNPHLKPYLDEWAAKIEAAYKAGTLIDAWPKAEIVSPTKSKPKLLPASSEP